MKIYSRNGPLLAGRTSAPSVAKPPTVMEPNRRIEDDRALGDREICRTLGISKPTLHRYRKVHGLPGPHFRVGQRSFTWRSELNKWIALREGADLQYCFAISIA